MLLVPKEPEESTAFFRFQVQKSPDPREIYEKGLAFLQAEYFQQPKEFSDRLTAVLPAGSALAAALLSEGDVRARVRPVPPVLPAALRGLRAGRRAIRLREASLWHNRMFNPALPDDVRVLAFRPDWTVRGKPKPERP